MCSRNLGLLLSILCVCNKESHRTMNVISLVICFLWLPLIAGIVAIAMAINFAQ